MIKLENFSIKFADKTILQETNLSFRSGSKVVISGASGCGKTSLFNALTGLLSYEGKLFINDLEDNSKNQALIRTQIGVLQQQPIMGADNVKDAILLPFSFNINRHNMPNDKAISQTLEQLQLSEKILSQTANNLSGGEKQKIALARILLLNRPILLADEITSALDERSKEVIIEIIKNLNMTVISIAHDKIFIDSLPIHYKMENKKLNIMRGE